MFWSILYFFLLIIFEGGESQSCENNIYELAFSNGCSIPEDDISVCKFDGCNMEIVNVTFDVVDPNGLVLVKFGLPPHHCCNTHYEVELLVNEEILNESSCSNDPYFAEKHSMKAYDIRKCKDGVCEGLECLQYAPMVFNYVYTSCYKLRIRPYKTSSTQASLYSKPFYVETNFTKMKIRGPLVVPHYRAKEKMYNVKLVYPQLISKSVIELNFCGNDTSMHREVVTKKAGIDSNSSVCVPVGGAVDSKCVNVFDEVSCTYDNITPGNYCIRIVIIDDRCSEGTVWTKNNPCRWSTILDIQHQPPDVPVASLFSYLNTSVTISIVICGILLLTIIAVFLLKKRKLRWSLTPGEPPDEIGRPMGQKLKVLLLYPRDCEDFMNVMNSFRMVLNQFDNIEVLDCYHDDDVLNGPLIWLQSLMSENRLCTIVVNSECAYLQQNAMKLGTGEGVRIYYKEPSFLDSVFLYGLKLIMEDISPDIYHKNFVIGLENFSREEHMLTLPTSFRRYIIPNHLKKLITDMSVENADEDFFLFNSPEYITLLNNLRILENYKAKNPHYLENLLNLI